MSEEWNAGAGGNTWQIGSTDDWKDDAPTNGDTWNGDNSAPANFDSTHGSGNGNDFGAADDPTGADSGCRNCGQEGHFARDCPEPRKQGACFNCGEEGHNKADCPKPRVFKGTCNFCSEEGHPASRCPTKPKICGRCKEEGHNTADCKNNFYLNLDDVASVTEAEAWSKMAAASNEDDIDDFKEALRMLQKAAPELTYPAIEKKLRVQKSNFYVIALKKDIGGGHTLVNLQGEPEKTYCVAIFKSPNCLRPNMVDKWPSSPAENIERLADAGVAMEKGVSYCRTCEQFGHSARDCKEERVPVEAPSVTCALCGEEGHRVRDCKEPRKKPREPRTCKICGSEDHIAKECDQKPDRPPMVCRNCEQEGHKASECTEERVLRCANCNAIGHLRRECPQPMDWSKAICRHCGEKGHLSASRCAPGTAKDQSNANNGTGGSQEINGAAAGDYVNGNSGSAVGNADWAKGNSASNGVNGGWEDGNTQTPVNTGGW